MAPALRESATWNAPELTPTTANDEINTSLAYGFGFDFCGVEIDRDTGEVRIDKYVTSHDCGTILNPGLADGQIHGSFAAAIGATLYEEFVYGEDGSFLSGTFAEYVIPTAAEIPAVDVLHPVQTPSPFTRLGAKGIAEGNQYSTPVCVANAVADALGRARHHDPAHAGESAVLAVDRSEERPSRHAAGRYESAPRRGLTGSGSVIVPAAPEVIWPALLDPETLRKAIPGCEELVRVGRERLSGNRDARRRPGARPVRAQVKLSDLEPPRAGVLSGTLDGPLGAASGRGTLALASDPAGCKISYDYDIQLTGKVAMVGGRLVDAATRHLIGEFFRRFAQAAAPTAQTNDRAVVLAAAVRSASHEAGKLRLRRMQRGGRGAGPARRARRRRARDRGRAVAHGHAQHAARSARHPGRYRRDQEPRPM